MSGYALHLDAFNDLDDIWKFIASDNIDAADRVIGEIFDAVGALVLFPHQGHRPTGPHARPDTFSKGAQLPDCTATAALALWLRFYEVESETTAARLVVDSSTAPDGAWSFFAWAW